MWTAWIGMVLGLAMAVAALGAPQQSLAAGDGSGAAARGALDARMGYDQAHMDAHDKVYSKQHHACMKASGGATLQMLNCMATESDRLDGLLNLAYRQRLAALPAARGRQLRELQRGWLKQRRRYCDTTVVGSETGSIVSVIVSDCFNETTIERTLFIQRFR